MSPPVLGAPHSEGLADGTLGVLPSQSFRNSFLCGPLPSYSNFATTSSTAGAMDTDWQTVGHGSPGPEEDDPMAKPTDPKKQPLDSIGIGGGLSIMWSNSVQLSIRSYSPNFIDCELQCSVRTWRFTGFYGYPERTRRRDSWQLLRSLVARSSLPWLCASDYNDITADFEKDGGSPRALFLINGFRAALLDANMSNIFTMGSMFTYVYRGTSPARVREKLDRACATSSWNSLFENAVCTNLVAPVSDHSPLFVDTNGSVGRTNRNFSALGMARQMMVFFLEETR
ncbi:hypothetical protein K2173_014942 [Erythroxylum novogranatense]|uniref:Endonuclease/exonuclease/phosphatase domain-containing protein n=1 Tax=Erythroxylum novogranatense TaxID=1862640 RepID=A0AAV8TTJ2_9ROSI|nr:hypothetical protein K2173_014942 [Erythroxylum novogranatense]